MKKLLTALTSFLLVLTLTTPSWAAGEATLDLSPQSATKKVDNLFSVEIRVNSGGVAVNTVKAYLTFDPNVLEVTNVNTSGSIATIFTENEPDNINGTIHITGAASGAGFTGEDGLFATINLRAKASGTSTLTFTSESRVLSNVDSSDVLNFTGLVNGSYTVSGSSTTTGAGGGDSEASGSGLPESGVFTDTALIITLGAGLVLVGIFISNPYLLTPKLAKRRATRNILKKL